MDTVLAESGGHQPDALRDALLELRGFAHAPALSPYGSVQAKRPITDLGGARRARRRVGLASLAVVAAMGLGVGAAAAASRDFRESAQATVAGLIGGWAGPAVAVAPEVSVSTPPAPPVAPATTPPVPQPTTSPAATSSAPGTAHDNPGRSEEATRQRQTLPAMPALPALPALPEQAASAAPRARVPDRGAAAPETPRSAHVSDAARDVGAGVAHRSGKQERDSR